MLQPPSDQWRSQQPGSVDIPVRHVDSSTSQQSNTAAGVTIPVQHMNARTVQPMSQSQPPFSSGQPPFSSGQPPFSPGYPRGHPAGMPTPAGQDSPCVTPHQQQPFPNLRQKPATTWDIPVQQGSPRGRGAFESRQNDQQSSRFPSTGGSRPRAPQTQWSAAPTVAPKSSAQKLAPDTKVSDTDSRASSPALANMSPLETVQQIKEQADELQEKVNQFTGAKSDKEYRFIEEMLTRLLLKLDGIESDGKEEIRTIRREAVKTIQASIDHLELRALGSDVSPGGRDSYTSQDFNSSNNMGEGGQQLNNDASHAQGKTGVTEMVLESEMHC